MPSLWIIEDKEAFYATACLAYLEYKHENLNSILNFAGEQRSSLTRNKYHGLIDNIVNTEGDKAIVLDLGYTKSTREVAQVHDGERILDYTQQLRDNDIYGYQERPGKLDHAGGVMLMINVMTMERNTNNRLLFHIVSGQEFTGNAHKFLDNFIRKNKMSERVSISEFVTRDKTANGYKEAFRVLEEMASGGIYSRNDDINNLINWYVGFPSRYNMEPAEFWGHDGYRDEEVVVGGQALSRHFIIFNNNMSQTLGYGQALLNNNSIDDRHYKEMYEVFQDGYPKLKREEYPGYYSSQYPVNKSVLLRHAEYIGIDIIDNTGDAQDIILPVSPALSWLISLKHLLIKLEPEGMPLVLLTRAEGDNITFFKLSLLFENNLANLENSFFANHGDGAANVTRAINDFLKSRSSDLFAHGNVAVEVLRRGSEFPCMGILFEARAMEFIWTTAHGSHRYWRELAGR